MEDKELTGKIAPNLLKVAGASLQGTLKITTERYDLLRDAKAKCSCCSHGLVAYVEQKCYG